MSRIVPFVFAVLVCPLLAGQVFAEQALGNLAPVPGVFPDYPAPVISC